MRYRLALLVVCCLMVVGCIADFTQKSKQEVGVPSHVNNSPTSKQKQSNVKRQKPVKKLEPPVKEFNYDKLKFKREKVFNTDCYLSVNTSSYITLEKTGRKNALGNSLYQICLYAEGELKGSYDVVTGRAYTQKRNRNKSRTQAPAPDGKYKVAEQITYSPLAEMGVGGRFLQIHPQFRTARTEIGLHYDPSFEKPNGQDGTSGCIALTKRANLDKVLEYFRAYRPKYMFVDIE